jgi:polysaccharide export outer membrane protein
MRYTAVIVSLLLGTAVLAAQEPAIPGPGTGAIQQWNDQILETGRVLSATGESAREDYRIGPEDLVEVSVFEVPELSRTVRVSASGDISLPLLGIVKVEGLSPRQLEEVLTGRLRGTYLRDPQVSVFLKEYKSDPVSVVGAVKMPGLYQIQTRKSLIEVLAMAQGFSENPMRQPGRTIIIMRSPKTQWKVQTVAGEPASGESAAGAAGPQSIEIPIKHLIESGDPQWNATVYPGDVVKVGQAGTFYVAGDVKQPGAFPLRDFSEVSVLQALAMAGGPLKSSDLKHSLIVRRDAAGNRVEEKIDLRRSRKGDEPETHLGENDILFVPGSATKAAALRALETTIQVGTGILIWR